MTLTSNIRNLWDFGKTNKVATIYNINTTYVYRIIVLRKNLCSLYQDEIMQKPSPKMTPTPPLDSGTIKTMIA